jgi:hypothetical protein
MNEQIPQTADAQIWAKEFVRIVKENPAIAADEETMIGWFSNSIMAGYDFVQKKNRQNNANLREALSAQQHEIWAHWMRYQFSCCTKNSDGSLTIPSDKVERWQRQLETDYNYLSEKERESDRDQADKMLTIIKAVNDGGLERSL